MTVITKTQAPSPSDTAADATANGSTSTSGKGMPAKTPQQASTSQVDKPVTPEDASVEASLRLPHERDQSTDMTPDQQSEKIKQASVDVKRGIKDTSKATETDQAYEKLR
ncbi:MAG: hypothetical protein V4772_09840 [Pseudomonadota bacterium]